MQVNTPSSVSHAVLKHAMIQYVTLIQDVVAPQSAALSHSGQRTHPFQIVILGAVVAAVFDMVPNAVKICVKLVADILVFLYYILTVARKLQPPVTVFDTRAADRRHASVLLRVFRLRIIGQL